MIPGTTNANKNSMVLKTRSKIKPNESESETLLVLGKTNKVEILLRGTYTD